MMMTSLLADTTPMPNGKTFSQDNKSGKGSGMADFDTFIKLLVAQMKNQDPTEPVDATQQVAQLAAFSAVEQATHTNTKLAGLADQLDALLAGNATLQAADYVGKYVSNDDGSISGTVKSVKIYNDGLIATLDNGKELVIGPGVSVRAKADAAAAASGKAEGGKAA